MGINKDLGLPFGEGMQKVAVCIDVDGTLMDSRGDEFRNIGKLLVTLFQFKNVKIVVWSGGGKDYAEVQGNRLGFEPFVWRYMSKLQHQELRDAGYLILAIDDVQDTRLGDINLIVRNK